MFDRSGCGVIQKVLTTAGCGLAALALLTAVTGCGSDKPTGGDGSPAVSGPSGSTAPGATPVPSKITAIDDGSHNAHPVKRDTLVRAGTPAGLRTLRRRIYADSARGPSWPTVDFANSELLAVLLAPGGGGESVKIDGIDRKDEIATVHATHIVPGDNCVVAAVVTSPYVVVVAPRQPATLTLDVRTEQHDC